MKIEKIQSLAKNLSSLIPSDVNTLTDTYVWLESIQARYSQYFNSISISDYFKLFISIWSYKRTGNFRLAQNILNQMFFVSFMTTEKIAYEVECDECSGNGNVPCYECEDGIVNCDECDGNGTVDCEDCNGDGWTGDEGDQECESCAGDGEVTCSDCGGDGRTTCGECGGSGNITCGECDGNGWRESDESTYNVLTYLSWNRDLENLAEIRMNSIEGIDYEEFRRLVEKDSVLISDDEGHGLLKDDVSEGDYYIFDINDDGQNLHYSGSSRKLYNTYQPVDYLN